jgi:hypothetical protein
VIRRNCVGAGNARTPLALPFTGRGTRAMGRRPHRGQAVRG